MKLKMRHAFVLLSFIFSAVRSVEEFKEEEVTIKINCGTPFDVPASLEQIDNKQALQFLGTCQYRFIRTFIGTNQNNAEKVNPVLKKLKLTTVQDWEELTETTSEPNFANSAYFSDDYPDSELYVEEFKEKLESCVTDCRKSDRRARWRGKAYEERLEKFVGDPKSYPKPAYRMASKMAIKSLKIAPFDNTLTILT